MSTDDLPITTRRIYHQSQKSQPFNERESPFSIKEKVTKNYAKYRLFTPSGPLDVLEMDIKFAWVASEMKHAYILTVLDVFTRTALAWHAGFSIKTTHSEKSVGSSN